MLTTKLFQLQSDGKPPETTPTKVMVLEAPFFYMNRGERTVAMPGDEIELPKNDAYRLKNECRVRIIQDLKDEGRIAHA